MKVVVVHNIISPYKTLLFNELAKRLHGLRVIYFAVSASNREWDVRREDLHFDHEVLSPRPLDRSSPVYLAARTRSRLDALDPEVVILGGYADAACWSAFAWARARRRKIILWSSTTSEDHVRHAGRERLKSILVRRSDAANVYGTRSRDYLVGLGMPADRIFVKGQATDNDHFAVEAARQRVARRARLVDLGLPPRNLIYVGRFSPEKNLPFLLDAWRRVHASAPGWGLLLVGSGPLETTLRGQVARDALPRVHFSGYRQQDELPGYLALSDMLVLPSVSEPWGLVVNEAMAAGLPVLVSERCGCAPDLVIEGTNGHTFDPWNMDQLTGYLLDALEGRDDLAAMGRASHGIVAAYTPARSAEVIAATVEFVLATPTRSRPAWPVAMR